MTAIRQTPTTTNFGATIGEKAYADLVNIEVTELWKRVACNLTVSSGTNVLVVTCNPTLTALSTPMLFLIAPPSNTGAVTINIDGLGAVGVLNADGTALIKGNFVSGTSYLLYYNGTNHIVIGGKTTDIIFNVQSYGALGDYAVVLDGAMASGSTTLTSASSPFLATDVGKYIAVLGAGAAGITLITTIASFTSSSSIALTAANASGGAISAKTVEWGHDDAAAFQAAFNAAKASGGRVFIPRGGYLLSRLNCTNVTLRVEIFGEGVNATRIFPCNAGSIYGTGVGHVFDLTGSAFIKLRGFQVGAFYSPVAPDTGIFMAQVGSNASNRFILEDIYITGQYTSATWYCYGVPSSSAKDCDFYNYKPGAGSQGAAIFTNSNINGLSSSFATVVTPGSTSTSDWSMYDCEFHKFSGAGADHDVVLIDAATELLFSSGVISGGAARYVTINGSCRNLKFEGLSFETESQPVIPTFVFLLTATAVLNGLSVDQCFYIVVTPTTGLMSITGGGQFNSARAGQVLAFTSAGALSATNTYFVGPADNDTVAASNVAITITERGLLLNMWANTSASPGQTPGYTITVMINGTATALTGVISGSNVQVKDQAHAVQVNQGDAVCFKIVCAATTNTTRLSAALTFLPTG